MKWFTSGKFDDQWAIDQLESVIQKCGRIELPSQVLRKLSILAGAYPKETIKITFDLVRDVSNPSEIYGWTDALEAILDKTTTQDDVEV
jgi:hypothetical protein